MSKMIKWRELTAEQRDGYVAEMVMGKRVYRYPDISHPDKIVPGRVVIVDEDDIIIAKPEPYSTSMDSAWQVLKHVPLTPSFIQELGGFVEIRAIGFSVLRAWTPELICIAALIACGAQVDTQQP